MDTRKFAMHYGALLGILLVIIALLLWVFGIDQQKSAIPSILNNLIIIGFLFYSIIQYRDNENNGYISYSGSLKLGTTVAFFSSIIMAFYTFIYMFYLNPDILSNILNMAEESILRSNPEVSDEELDFALEITHKLTQPHWLMIMGVLSGTFMGFLYSAIVSFFIKKSDPNKIA